MNTPANGPADDASPESVITSPSQSNEKKQTSLIREIIETALIAILIFVLVRSVVLNFKVDGESMLPTFQDGEMVLVHNNAYGTFDVGDVVDWVPGVPDQHWFTIVDWGEPSRGDVIVFTPPEPGEQKPYIKRVIGLPGDRVQITADDTVMVNGVTLDEEYVGDYETECRWSPENCDITVAEGTVYVLGDHRTGSEDSRYFGLVNEDRIIGKAWLVYWPAETFGTVKHPDYPELNP